jgi:hypothetical protein
MRWIAVFQFREDLWVLSQFVDADKRRIAD